MKATAPLTEAIIYTDGSVGANRDGGWAAIVATPYYGVEISGFESETTNNRMELFAAIKALEFLPEPHAVKLVSDSAYMINAIANRWYIRWFAEYIKRGESRPNLDLWQKLSNMLQYHTVEPIKVKGHDGHEHNERVDKLAVSARKDRTGGIGKLYGNTRRDGQATTTGD